MKNDQKTKKETRNKRNKKEKKSHIFACILFTRNHDFPRAI